MQTVGLNGSTSMWSALKGYPGRAFAVCLATYTFAQMDLALFGYAIPAIREEFDLSLRGVMSIVSSAFVLGGLMIVWLGLMTDRLGRRLMIQLSFIGSSILVTLHAFVPNPASLAVLRGSSIAVGGLSYPVTGAIISEEFPARYRGFFLGILQIGYPLGWALASVLAAWILVDYGWRQLFFVGLVSIPFTWVIRRLIREPARFSEARSQRANAKLSDLLAPGIRSRAVLLFCAQYLFVWAYAGSIFTFPSFLSEDRGLGRDAYSTLIGAGHVIGVLGYVLAAYVGEYLLTRRTTVIIWTWLGALTFEFMVWGTETYTATLLAFGVMTMFFYGSAAVKFAYLAEVFPTHVRATALATCGSLAVTLGSASGPLMVSLIQEKAGWDIAYTFAIGIPLVSAGILYLFLKPVPSGLEIEEVEALLSADDVEVKDK